MATVFKTARVHYITVPVYAAKILFEFARRGGDGGGYTLSKSMPCPSSNPRPPPHVFHEFNALTYDVTLCFIPLHVNETANWEYG